ncbi:von Willebrand factor A domain-containing protein 5A-like isoform X3 [Monodelphis domestica]|uniref:von Willebrand factor A domain-containing protein 5A-like isoform X3 n=1 Tax=Monodelphis domestica TaxID=13616 RepID=UPI00028BD6F6|nr:von Willebrand factor A domain-containing protein 5A-like isoform X3 [Monodelphis domestica]XP_056650154.1 von Willebrand factor A domain-containing protein 5A-like isoform X3 [Monodelphis domestica]
MYQRRKQNQITSMEQPCGLLTLSKQPVPLKSISVDVSINQFVADVSATLDYKNEETSPVEALFVFPMDEDSAVYSFQAVVDGKNIVGEIREKQKAQEDYENAISQGQEAFLLEQDNSSRDIFRCSIGNLPPGQKATVTLSYVQELSLEADEAVRFVLPAILNPRYLLQESAETDSITSHISRIPGKELPYTFSVSANICSSNGIEKVHSSCALSPLKYLADDKTVAQVSLAEGHKFDRDVEILVYYGGRNTPSVSLELPQAGAKPGSLMGDTAMMVSFYPSIPVAEGESTSGEFIFLVDRSGSMASPLNYEMGSQLRISSAKETLILLLKSLPLGCYFNIYGFGSSFDYFFPESVEYTQQTMEEAVQRVKSLEADLGGTEILEPLKSIYSKSCKPNHPRQLFVFTDGEVCDTGLVIAEVRRHSQNHRCFSFGIGEGASTSLIKGIARAAGGTAEFITGKDRMQPKALRSLKQALQPMAQDISFTWTLPPGLETTLLFPAPTIIFQGQRLILYAQLKGTNAPKGAAGEVCLQYTLRGNSVKSTVPFSLDPKADDKLTIHRLAAKSLIQTLEGSSEDAAEKKKKVMDISLQSGVVSPHTAYIAINKELNEPIQGPLIRRDIPLAQMAYRPMKCMAAPKAFRGPLMAKSLSNCAGPPVFHSASCGPLVKKKKSSRHENFARSSLLMQCSIMESDTVPSPPESPLLQLISLQKADGSWELDEALASVLGVSVQAALAALPDQSKDVPSWATILAVLWLHSSFWGQREEWELLEKKAVAWIQAHSDSSLGECIEAANALLKSSVDPAVFGL